MEFSNLDSYKTEILGTQEQEHMHLWRSTADKPRHFQSDTLSTLQSSVSPGRALSAIAMPGTVHEGSKIAFLS